MTEYLPNELSGRAYGQGRSGMMLAAALLAMLLAPWQLAPAQEADVIEAGRKAFAARCVVCHGPEAKGDGALAPHLKTQPADLTRLTARAGGSFPFWQSYRRIDGRDFVAAHGPDEMPVWGAGEETQGQGDGLSIGQILTIVFFLESIQEGG